MDGEEKETKLKELERKCRSPEKGFPLEAYTNGSGYRVMFANGKILQERDADYCVVQVVKVQDKDVPPQISVSSGEMKPIQFGEGFHLGYPTTICFRPEHPYAVVQIIRALPATKISACLRELFQRGLHLEPLFQRGFKRELRKLGKIRRLHLGFGTDLPDMQDSLWERAASFARRLGGASFDIHFKPNRGEGLKSGPLQEAMLELLGAAGFEKAILTVGETSNQARPFEFKQDRVIRQCRFKIQTLESDTLEARFLHTQGASVEAYRQLLSDLVD